MAENVVEFPTLAHPADRLWDTIVALDALEHGRAVVHFEDRAAACERLRWRVRTLRAALAAAKPEDRVGMECEVAICPVTGEAYVKKREPVGRNHERIGVL